ncbi:MAG: peptide chain release factor 1 [Bacilli bacterium]|nr:peptide chain release factor 1 [Bacilli bacterium]
MIERLEIIKKKHEEINAELLKTETLNDYLLQQKLNKEKSLYDEPVEKYIEYQKCIEEVNGLKELLTDSEMSEIAQEEIEKLNDNIKRLISELEILLIPKDEYDGKNIIMEIRGAAGGDEANIFAGDLFRMYSKYAEKNNWKTEIIHAIEGTSGGYSQIEFAITGENVYSKLKFESGAHRVQRIPTTETQGRVHTSTSTVVVLPEVEDIEVELKTEDVRVDVYRSSGKGGQGVNTTDSAVRLTHLPTGIVVTCQNERSQIKNKERAMKVLKSKINDLAIQNQEKENDSNRKSKIGTGDRSEKIRTYNYPQNRVTDHRINYSSMELDRIMDGQIDNIIEELTTEDQKRKMENSQ